MKSSSPHTASDYPLPAEAGDEETFKRRIQGESANSVLEICRRPTPYSYAIARALKLNGFGNLCTLEAAHVPKNQKFYRLLAENELEAFHSKINFKKSYHWALQRLANNPNLSPFDICLITANKRFESAALTAVLADMLIRPGGLLVFPGANWTMQSSRYFRDRPDATADIDQDELTSHPLEMVRDTILLRLGYRIIQEPNCPHIIFARKPA